MSSCDCCPVEKECFYIYKPCDCIYQRKFWGADRREEHDRENAMPDNLKNVNKVLEHGRSKDNIFNA